MRTKRELEQYGCQINGLRIEYVAPTRFIALLEHWHNIPGLWGLYYWAYNLWQKRAYARAKELHAAHPFDIVHQLNMIGYREPGYLWKLPIPFVWGPVGGGPNEPIAYHKMFSWNGCVKVLLRTWVNELQKRICLRAKRAARVAQKVWAVTEADYRMIHDLWGVECEKMVETGTVLRNEGRVRRWDGKSPLKIVWSGIHTSRKALPVLLHALAKLNTNDWRCGILGEGPETVAWKSLANRLGVAEHLSWHGRLPHDEALRVMNEGHIFAFPSLKEGTPHVVLEALSLGLPVICHDACGMGTVVTEKCGFKMPLKNPETSIAGFADALDSIMKYPDFVAAKSAAALSRANEITWEAKVRHFVKVYDEIKNFKS
jgi:glycosyltransferase involved in cell wall biosynthesis